MLRGVCPKQLQEEHNTLSLVSSHLLILHHLLANQSLFFSVNDGTVLVVAPLILAPEKKIIADLHREDTHSSVNRTFAHNSYPLPKIKSCQVVSINRNKTSAR